LNINYNGFSVFIHYYKEGSDSFSEVTWPICGIALAFFMDAFQFACTKCLVVKRRCWSFIVVIIASLPAHTVHAVWYFCNLFVIKILFSIAHVSSCVAWVWLDANAYAYDASSV